MLLMTTPPVCAACRAGHPEDYKLLCAWFSGVEGKGTVNIVVSELRRNGTAWSTPVSRTLGCLWRQGGMPCLIGALTHRRRPTP